MRLKLTKAFALSVFSLFLSFAIASCNDDNGNNDPSIVTHEDSLRVISLVYEEYKTPDDVKIMTADSSVIRVSNDLLARIGAEDIHIANFIAIWRSINEDPFYIRATKIDKKDSYTDIQGNKAEPFEAFNDLDIDLSTDFYYNSSNIGANTLSGGLPITPYTEIGEDGRIIIHPVAVVIGNRPENSDVINMGCIDSRLEGYEKGSLITVEQLVKDGKVNDINNPIPNWSKSWSLDHNFGDQSFTVYGSSTYNIKGSYTELIRKKDRELGKEAGTNPFGLKIMLDSLGLRLKGGLTISVSTKWFKLKKFEMYGTIGYGLNIKAVGLAGGVIVLGQKELLSATPINCFFMLGIVPIKLDVSTALVAKWNLESLVCGKYNCNLDFYRETDLGIGYNGSMYTINRTSPSSKFEIYKPSSFKDFVSKCQLGIKGNGDVGLYLRMGAHIYGVGPTLGVGARVGITGDIGADADFDEEGNWTGVRTDAKLEGNFNVDAEVGGEVRVLGKTVWNRQYNFSLWEKNLFTLK